MYWVIGKNGVLSQAIQKYAKAKDIQLIATSSNEVDITSKEQINRFLEKNPVKVVINSAAFTDVDRAEANPQKAFAINANGPKNLAQITQGSGIKLVHISTDYVFNGETDQPYKEDNICAPINVYGMTKLYGEQYLQEHDPKACIIRTSWLYGHGGKNFPDKIFELLQTKPSFRVVEDQFSAPTFANDLAEAIFQLVEHEGIIHYCNSGFISRYLWAKMMLGMLAEKKQLLCREITPVPTWKVHSEAKRPLHTCLSTEKYKALTGKIPPNWVDSFKHYMEHNFC